MFFNAFIIKNTNTATKKMSNNIVRYVPIIGINAKKLRNNIATKLNTNDCAADFEKLADIRFRCRVAVKGAQAMRAHFIEPSRKI